MTMETHPKFCWHQYGDPKPTTSLILPAQSLNCRLANLKPAESVSSCLVVFCYMPERGPHKMVQLCVNWYVRNTDLEHYFMDKVTNCASPSYPTFYTACVIGASLVSVAYRACVMWSDTVNCVATCMILPLFLLHTDMESDSH